MAHGTVPIAGAISSLPQILAATGAGVAHRADDIPGLTEALMRYVNEPAVWQAASRAGVSAAPQFGYRAYQDAVRALFDRAWGIDLAPAAATNRAPAVAQPSVYANGHVRH